MKRLYAIAGAALLSLSALAADIPLPSGYYRVQNKWSERFITLIDNRGSINYGAMTADLGAIVTLPNFDNIVDNPGTIIYLNKASSDKYDLQSQGTSTIQVVDHVLQLANAGEGAYLAYASQSGVTMYLSDSGPKDEPYGVISTQNSTTTNKRLHWYARPIDANSSDSYFGLKPKKIGSAYYTTFYASFPYELSTGMTAYYISKVDEAKGMAIIKEVSGHVPGATPVLIKSANEGAANNKLNLLPPSAGSINGNLLKGVYFMNVDYANPKHLNVVKYEPSTMRVLSTAADGSVAFVKATSLTYIPANSAYLTVSASAPSEIKVVTEEEYQSSQEVTITAKNVTIAYGDAIPKFEYEASATITGEPSLTCEATSTSPVGTYVIKVGQGTVTGATVKGVNGTLTITAAELTVKANDATRVEGEENPAFTLTYKGFKNSETEAVLTEKPTAATTATKESAPGTYDITVSGGKAQNYTFKYEKGTLTVTEAKLIIKAKDKERIYGDANPAFEYEVVEGTVKGGEPKLSCVADAKSAVGEYAIKVEKGTLTNNNVEFVDGKLTVKPAELTVKANDATRVEGEENPAFTLTYKGFKNSETEAVLTEKPTATTTATKESPAGTYDITVSGGKATNYTFKYEKGTLTVTEAAHEVTITAKNVTITYGDAIPTFEYEASAEITGEPSLTCEATSTSPVGTYVIKVGQGTVTGATVKGVDGTLTITPAELTVKANDVTRMEGEENPEFTLSYKGFKNNETEEVLTEKPTATTTATKESAPGTYDITVSGGEATNYTFKYENGTLTVIEKLDESVIVTALSYERFYGDPNPEFAYESVGAELIGEPELSCEADEKSPVGTYPIKVATGTIENGALTLVDGVLTIKKAPLTVIAVDTTRCVDEENPEFELIYEGFKNGETDTVFIEKPTVICYAGLYCAEGNYDIIVSGGEAENYELSYVNGTLVVSGWLAVEGVLFNDTRKQNVYTVSGQKVNTTKLRKGIYVIGNRKVVVK